MKSIIGTVEDTIIIKGFIKLRHIDIDNNVVFKIKRAYLYLFNLTYLLFISMLSFLIFLQFQLIFALALYIII